MGKQKFTQLVYLKKMPDTKEEIIEKAAKTHKSGTDVKVDLMMIIMIGIIVVLLTTLGGMIQSSMATKSATYQDLVNKVNEQNIKIDLILDEMRQGKLKE